MKLHLFSRLTKTVALAACTAMALSSCHTTLYNAAARGDVETVRKELSAGAPVNESASKANICWQVPAALVTVPVDVVQVCLNIGTLGLYSAIAGGDGKIYPISEYVFKYGKKTPAEVAYERGHTAVLDELAKAGAVVAPKSAVGKELVLVTERHAYSPLDINSKMNDIFEDIQNENNIKCKYWCDNLSYEQSSSDEDCMKWTTSNIEKIHYADKDGYEGRDYHSSVLSCEAFSVVFCRRSKYREYLFKP